MEAILDIAWSPSQLLLSTARHGEAIMWDLREKNAWVEDERDEGHSTSWLDHGSAEHGFYHHETGHERPEKADHSGVAT